MQGVAHHLQTHANALPATSDQFDFFARSAFNRYYYACYLRVRDLLGEIEPVWRPLPHHDIPGVLKGSLLEAMQKKLRRLRGDFGGDARKILSEGIAAARQLSDLMKAAYAARVVADYHPEVLVTRLHSGRFKLDEIDISAAHDWQARADLHCSKIRRAWAIVDE